ncbi:hypothetical protein [Photobacterium rosenbergii]|uniref:MFS transporter n=1 Tax=Photobacterium rosenbergii TaxID=294936 RepID=A0ABU3ZHU6_9GAMM|nr:hypothetical protein [Photobacterium rosenbergii]MDV5169709.1 hypothetical protein [Photobacterium rosenbergii]
MTSNVIKVYALLAITVLFDMSIQIAMIWKILELTGSTVYMGIIVSIGAFTPYIISNIKRLSGKIYLTRNIFFLRLLLFFITLISIMTNSVEITAVIFLIAIISSCNMICAINMFEIKNSSFVRDELIEASNASRILQTTIQIGAFFGALLGGWLLKQYTLNEFFSYILILSGLISLFNLFIPRHQSVAQKVNNQEIPELSQRESFFVPVLLTVLTGLHIGSFNAFVPIFYQLYRDWGPEVLGLASGLAGVGALGAALLPQNKWVYLTSAFLIVIGDVGLFLLELPYLSILFCLFIGYAVNSVRISSRTDILKSKANEIDVNTAISNSNYYFYIVSGTVPMLIIMSLSFFSLSPLIYGVALVLIGLATSISILILTIKQSVKPAQVLGESCD